MITWVLGRSGAGKTEYLKEQLPRLAKQYEQVFYLVPEQNSMAAERMISGLDGERVKVVSFRRISNHIFRAFGGVAGSYMTRQKETALLYRVLLEEQERLCYYRKARPTMGFISRLIEAFDEFSLSGLSEEQVMPLIEQSGRQDWQEKYKDLFLLYRAFINRLDAENRLAGEELPAAIEKAAAGGYFKGSAILVDGFFGFTGMQRKLLGVMMEQAAEFYCALTLDPADRSVLFSTAKEELSALKRLASGAGLPQREHLLKGPSKRLQFEDLQYLEQNLFAPKPEEFQGKFSHLRILTGKNIREELTMVAADISRKVREEGYRYREIAVIAGNCENYGPLADGIFRRYRIPLFLDKGRASLSRPLFAFAASAIRLIRPDRYFRSEDILSLLKSGLCGEDPDLISRLESYCISWQIKGDKWIREEPFMQNPGGLRPRTAKSEEDLAALNGLRDRLRAPLLAFRDRAKEGSGEALAEALYRLFCDFSIEEQITARAEEYLNAANSAKESWIAQQYRRISKEYMKHYGVMMDILDDIYEVFGKEPLSLYALEELIGLCAEQTALHLAPQSLDAVSMGEVAHCRLEGVKVLYVVGASQGLLPMPISDQGLIGDRERRLFAEHHLPCNATLKQNTLQGQYRFYGALFSASHELIFSHSAFQMDGSPMIPSVYLQKLQKLCNLSPILREQMDLYDFAATEESARELAAWKPLLREEILAEIGSALPPEREQEEALPQAVVQRIFGNRLRLSYSQISLFQNCPFHYFMEKTMRIRANEPIRFDAANIGTFIHDGMEQLIKTLQKEGFNYDKYTKEEIQRFGEDMARRYLQETLQDLERSNRFDALFKRMTGLFCRVAENVVAELKEGKFIPYGAEFSLGGHPLALEDGREVELIGSIDRVDTYEENGATYLKVTDYKTGRQSFDLRGITNRTGVQLPIYLYGIKQAGLFKDPRPAAACYMEAHTPEFKEAFPPEELEERLREFYKRGGAFSADPAALAALDQQAGARHFKIAYTKDGALKSNVKAYEPRLMEEMVDHMEEILKDTARSIFAGDTRVAPLKGKEQDACRYCDFKAVCRYEEAGGKERIWQEEPFGWREQEKKNQEEEQ